MNDDMPLPRISAAAARMRLLRQRRRDGLRCLIIELRETEIDAMIRIGVLRQENRGNAEDVIDGLYSLLEQMLK